MHGCNQHLTLPKALRLRTSNEADALFIDFFQRDAELGQLPVNSSVVSNRKRARPSSMAVPGKGGSGVLDKHDDKDHTGSSPSTDQPTPLSATHKQAVVAWLKDVHTELTYARSINTRKDQYMYATLRCSSCCSCTPSRHTACTH